MRLLWLIVVIAASGNAAARADPKTTWPTHGWEAKDPADLGLDQARLEDARTYGLRAGGAGLITRFGWRALAWGDIQTTYDLKSTTKSIGVMALGLAVDDRLMLLSDRARLHLPEIGVPPAENGALTPNAPRCGWSWPTQP